MEENHPYRSASGKVEIADVGCERMIIIKNYESLNYKLYTPTGGKKTKPLGHPQPKENHTSQQKRI